MSEQRFTPYSDKANHDTGAVQLKPQCDQGYISLRMDANNAALIGQLETALGAKKDQLSKALAQQSIGAVISLESAECTWALARVSPDEWALLFDGRAQSAARCEVLNQAMQGQWISLCDLSDQFAVFDVCGEQSRSLLAKAVPYDVHPAVFGQNTVVRTLAAKANVLIWHLDEADSYRVFVRRSWANYLWDWFVDATVSLKAA